MPTVTWDANFEGIPADADAANAGANKIRELKVAISERLELEMNFKTGTRPLLKAGQAAVCYSGNNTQVLALAAGNNCSDGGLVFNSTRSSLQRCAANVFADVGTLIPANSLMLFCATAAPTGWTLDANHNDRVIRVVSNAANGAEEGGDWTISGISVNNHTLTIAEMPGHNHYFANLALIGPDNVSYSGVAVSGGSTNQYTANTGGGGGHNHGLTIGADWRPAYLNMILCKKN